MQLTRITVNPDQMGGLPCIRGLRIPVATIVSMIADGMSHDEIFRAYPNLGEDDIREALALASGVRTPARRARRVTESEDFGFQPKEEDNMVYRGYVRGGVVVLDPKVELPEGIEVRVELPPPPGGKHWRSDSAT